MKTSKVRVRLTAALCAAAALLAAGAASAAVTSRSYVRKGHFPLPRFMPFW